MPSSHLVIDYEDDEQANKKTIFIFVGLYNKANKEQHESSLHETKAYNLIPYLNGICYVL
jgi:hypothetical protein